MALPRDICFQPTDQPSRSTRPTLSIPTVPTQPIILSARPYVHPSNDFRQFYLKESEDVDPNHVSNLKLYQVYTTNYKKN